jgi:hypothetical protein
LVLSSGVIEPEVVMENRGNLVADGTLPFVLILERGLRPEE